MVKQRHNDLHTQWSDIEAYTTPKRNNGESMTQTESYQIQKSPILGLEDEENIKALHRFSNDAYTIPYEVRVVTTFPRI